jgi:hypothetical protein
MRQYQLEKITVTLDAAQQPPRFRATPLSGNNVLVEIDELRDADVLQASILRALLATTQNAEQAARLDIRHRGEEQMEPEEMVGVVPHSLADHHALATVRRTDRPGAIPMLGLAAPAMITALDVPARYGGHIPAWIEIPRE